MAQAACCFNTPTNETIIFCFAPFTYCASSEVCLGATQWTDVCVIYGWCYALMAVAAVLLFIGLGVSICIACRCRRADVTYIYANNSVDTEPLIDSSGKKAWQYQEPVTSQANRLSAGVASEPATDTSGGNNPARRPTLGASQAPVDFATAPQSATNGGLPMSASTAPIPGAATTAPAPAAAAQARYGAVQQGAGNATAMYASVQMPNMVGGSQYLPGPYANAPYILYAAPAPAAAAATTTTDTASETGSYATTLSGTGTTVSRSATLNSTYTNTTAYTNTTGYTGDTGYTSGYTEYTASTLGGAPTPTSVPAAAAAGSVFGAGVGADSVSASSRGSGAASGAGTDTGTGRSLKKKKTSSKATRPTPPS
jgi:hypothetical protein